MRRSFNQVDLAQLSQATPKAEGVELELNELKAANFRRDIDEAAPVCSDTQRTILPKMHGENKPRQSTMDGHYRVIEELNSLR